MCQIKKLKTLHFLLYFSLILMVVSCGPARKSIAIEEGWDLLGELKPDFIRDKDVIEVHSTNKFTDLRFKVEKHEVRLNNLTVFFQNGDRLSPSLDEIIAPDQYSRNIEIAADGKFINKIEFKFRTTGNVFKGRANVLVFGKRYNGY
jgi:hypothetical protein